MPRLSSLPKWLNLRLLFLIPLFLVPFALPTSAEQTIVASGVAWRYNDQGVDLGSAWRAIGYPDSSWALGPSQLGYGDGDEATTLSYGGNTSNRYPTYYFRHTFNVADPSSVASLKLRYLRDDGCIIYLNGTEVVRSNLPADSVGYSTLATSAIGNSDETTWLEASVNPALLQAGPNVIAAEVHQSSLSSSDVTFNLELISTAPPVPAPTVTLVSPSDSGNSNSLAVSFVSSATDTSGLLSATLYLGSNLQTVTFSGTQQIQDTQISADQSTTNFGSATSINVDGLTPHAHGLMKFPNLIGSGTGQVPAGANVSSANLQINCTNFGNPLNLYRLTQDWVEGEATWARRSNAATWSSPGADGAGSNAGVALSGPCPATGLRNIDITPFVQEWSSGVPNHGMLIADGGTDGIDFSSSESGSSPVLTVVYQGTRQALQTKPLSGTSATVTFDVTLPTAQTYFWNVLVTNTSGGQSWAPVDFKLTIDPDAPNQPILILPPNGASGISTSPTLSAWVSDPNGGPLEVTFSARMLPAAEEFTIIALPDTQYYSESYPHIYLNQTQWIVNNKAARNIVFVTHLGDLVQNAGVTAEWQVANTSMTVLDNVVPYGMGPGNHDQPTTLFNQYFPYTRYQGKPWYGGHYSNTNDNNFQLFSAGGVDFLIIHLTFCPPAAAITWADSILKSYPQRKAIITTHGYLGATAARSVHGCTNTQYLWDGLTVANPNVHFMFSGHVHAEARRTDNVNGHPVHQVLSDYQDRAEGGQGWLRIMRFVPAENKIYVQTYSPYLNQFETDADSQFTLDFPMGGFATIGTVSNVTNGSTASMVWPNLPSDKQYEWQVTVKDSTGKTQTGPVWTFTTGIPIPNELPVANGQSITVNEDLATGIVLTANDPESAPLSYNVLAAPTHGTLTGSAPNLTYQPHANYSGPDSFTFKVNDGQADSNVATVQIIVDPINDAPNAGSDAYTTTQDTSLTINAAGVLGNDNDIDGGPLSAGLVLGPANGTLNLNSNGSFTYTPNSGFVGSDSFSYFAHDGFAGSNSATVAITITPAGGAPILSANFDSGSDGFSYLDNTFRSTSQSSYASGTRLASGGFSGGALSVNLGGINNNTITGMSGGWQRTFTLAAATPVSVSFRYNLTQTPEYESDEYSQVLISMNGVLYGTVPADYVRQVIGNGSGGGSITTGWQLFQVHLGTLPAGTHTISVGGYNNRKNATNESTTVLMDDLLVAPGSAPLIEAHFNSSQDGFNYFDDLFRSSNQPSYASGSRVTSGGFSGGALRVLLGGTNSNTVLGMSGGWRRDLTLAAPATVLLRFNYNLSQSAEYESDELSQMLLSVNGVLYGITPNDYLSQVVGNGSGGSTITTGWRSFELTIGLPAGTHAISIGAYNNKKNASNESTTALVDDVLIIPAL